MEALSPTMEEGQIVKWHKAEGDAVASGELLAEIETDKATMELLARGDGVLRKILHGEGDTAAVGAVIAVIAAEDEDIAALVADGGGSGGSSGDDDGEDDDGEDDDGGDHDDDDEGGDAPPEPKKGAKGKAPDEGSEEGGDGEGEAEGKGAAKGASKERSPDGAPATSPTPAGGRVKASPVARRLAADAGIDLGSVQGSGPGGRIVKRDVEEAAEGGGAAPGGAPSWSAPGAGEDDYEDLKVSQMRKTIARRLAESIGPVPHFFLTVDVDMGRAMEARVSMNALLEERGEKVSLNDFIIRAAAAALRLHPAVNASWQGDTIRRHNRVHVGVAVAVDDGLITPVVRDAHMKGVAQIGREVREMAPRAREKKLKPEEYTGATFSISNLGMFGIHEFTAVINPPEAAILAVGAVERVPVAVDPAPGDGRRGRRYGEVTVRSRMKMTLSCDHRVIDGATGARFLQTLKAMLEEPGVIVL